MEFTTFFDAIARHFQLNSSHSAQKLKITRIGARSFLSATLPRNAQATHISYAQSRIRVCNRRKYYA
jgi:hypothetical protein